MCPIVGVSAMLRRLFPQTRCTWCGYTIPPGRAFCPICARGRWRRLRFKKYQVALALLMLPFLLWAGARPTANAIRSAATAIALIAAPGPTPFPVPFPTLTRLAPTLIPTPTRVPTQAPTHTPVPSPTVVLPTLTISPSPSPLPVPTRFPLPSPTPTPAGPRIDRLVLYNADNERPIRTLADGATIDLSRDGTALTVVAIPESESEAGSVQFTLNSRAPCEIKADGETPCFENAPPYVLFGDNTPLGDYYEWNWNRLVGQNTITAVACQMDGLQGACGPAYEITVTVTQ